MKQTKGRIAATIHDVQLGVVSARGELGAAFQATEPLVYGTAFPIAEGLFVTAAHVLRDAEADQRDGGTVALFRKGPAAIEAGPATASETFPSVDLALLACLHFSRLPSCPFRFEPLAIHDAVTAAGYPHAIETDRLVFHLRGFAGTVMTRRELFHLPGQPPGYELSLRAPRGLSGAPLIYTNKLGDSLCCGWIIENWKYASGDFTAGVAVEAQALLSVDSQILSRPHCEWHVSAVLLNHAENEDKVGQPDYRVHYSTLGSRRLSSGGATCVRTGCHTRDPERSSTAIGGFLLRAGNRSRQADGDLRDGRVTANDDASDGATGACNSEKRRARPRVRLCGP